MKPKVITICGSSRFIEVMAICAWLLERDEGAIALSLHLIPRWYPGCTSHHLAEAEGVAGSMDELHLRKIDLSDEVFVVDWDKYVGESTKREIEYAKGLERPIRWFSSDPLGERVRGLVSTGWQCRSTNKP